MSRLAPLGFLLTLLLCACGAQDTRPDARTESVVPAPTVAQLPAPNDNLNAVAWIQTSTERDLIYRQVYRNATRQLDSAIADLQWEALAAGERKTPVVDPTRTAVIVDIDETVLDNGPYQARLVVDDTTYNKATWAEWCLEEKADALPGALDFTRTATSKGVTVFYLSNRAHELSKPRGQSAET